MKKITLFLVIALAIFIFISCVKVRGKKPIKIAKNTWAGTSPIFIAQKKGFFKKNNVKVKVILKRDLVKAKTEYRYGEADGLLCVLMDVITLNCEGFPTKVVYVADFSDTGDVIIARPEFNSLADLKGKTVSFEGLNTFSHLFVLKVLNKAGLKEADVRFKNVPAMDVLSALRQKKIDAGHTWQPVTSQAVKEGYKILATAGDIPGLITDVLVFKAEVIKERPNDIKAIIKSLLEARDFVYANTKEALGIMSGAERMSKEEMGEGIKGVRLLDLEDNIEAMKESIDIRSLFASGEIIGEFFLEKGQLSKMPDLDRIIEPCFVQELSNQEARNSK
jgi:NitT/TauT family transport system substrate-binding protein